MTTGGLSLAGEGLRRTFKKSGFTLDVPGVEVEPGTVLAVLGPSGSGKSTLLTVLGLLERPDEGRVYLDGKGVTVRDRDARLKMAAVFQRPYLFKGSVGANVGYGLEARHVPREERAERIGRALERVGLAGYEKRSALALSGGEAQRVSLARALVVEPQVLLLDEPLASLDPLLKQHLTRDFASILREAAVTVVYVTHDQDEAMVVSDRVVILNEGRVVASGSVDDIMGLPADEWVASFLGVEAPMTGVAVRTENGLSYVACCGVEIATTTPVAPGTPVTFGVRPEDVLLFGDEVDLPLSSARNRLHAKVTEIAPRGSTYHVVLEADGVPIASSISRAAATEMDLHEGSQVLAVFKASAVRVRPIET